MKLIRTTSPDKKQKQDLLLLQELCQSHDKITATFPFEEDCIYYLLYNEAVLLSALSAFFDENNGYECLAFTQPDQRRKGCFSTLLRELEKELGDSDFIFPVNNTSLDAINTLKAMEAGFWYEEHMMELNRSDFKKSMAVFTPVLEGLSITPAMKAEKGNRKYRFMIDGSQAGSCFFDFRENHGYFYGFEIKENLRNQGRGTACLHLFLNELFKLPGFERLLLQVSGQNHSAMALYKKAGFRIIESLSYYIY